MAISSAFPHEKNKLTVDGQTMAYVEVDEGDPILQEDSPDSSGVFCALHPASP